MKPVLLSVLQKYDGEVCISIDCSDDKPYHVLYVKPSLEYNVLYKADSYDEAWSAIEIVYNTIK